jgi:hypothetical protein
LRDSLTSQDYLVEVAADATQVTTAAILDLIMIGAIVAIPVVIFPILRRYSESLARGYLAARILEGVVLVTGTLSLLGLLALSREVVAAGGLANATQSGTLGAALKAACDNAGVIGGQIVFCFSALILNYALYKGRIIPRPIALWGLIGVPLTLASGVLVLFRVVDESSTLQMALILPLAVQEMVFALWLIARGFSRSALGSR